VGLFVDEILELGERHDDEDGERIEYIHWTSAETRVVSGPIRGFHYPGIVFPDRAAARAFWGERADIIAEYLVEGRWVFRIKRGPLRKQVPEDVMRTKLDVKRFVKEWTLSETITEVSTRMGMARASVNNYAIQLRRAGVKLKALRDGRCGNDVNIEELNALIAEVQ